MNQNQSLEITVSSKEDITANMLAWLEATMGPGMAEAMLPDLGPMFLEDTPSLLASFRQALAQHDARGLQEAAHTLKGSSASMGLLRLSNLCLDLETLSKAGAFEEAAAKLPGIEAEYRQVADVLQAYC